MIPRERVLKTIQHQEPDRVPLDEAYYSFSLQSPEGRQKLMRTVGLSDVDGVKDFLGIDLRDLFMMPSETFMGQAVYKEPPWVWVHELPGNRYRDEWGIEYEIGATGEYFHYVHHPLEGLEKIDDYQFLDLNAPGRFETAEEQMRRWSGKYAICGHMEATLFEQAWYLRGFRRLIRDLYDNEAFCESLFDKLLEFRLEQAKRWVELGVDIIRLGDDFGTQTGMLISLATWRRYFKPRMKKLIDTLKKSRLYVFYHSDGCIEPLIPELIEIGVDILNPLQPECNNIERIKREFGTRLTLHGTVSVQRTLPFGTIEDVENEVRSRLKICAPGGGLILAPCHAVGPDVTIEKLITLYRCAQNYGKYPLRI